MDSAMKFATNAINTWASGVILDEYPKEKKDAMLGREFRSAATLNAAPDDRKLPGLVEGIAVAYNQVGYFWGERIAVAPGAASESLAARAGSDKRDALVLLAHDSARVLGRMANDTLRFEEREGYLWYQALLNLDDPEGRSVYEKIKRGDFSAASIGFTLEEGEYKKLADNSPEAESDAPVEVFVASKIDVFEVSLVAQGVYGRATTQLAQLRSQLPEGYAIVSTYETETNFTAEVAESDDSEAEGEESVDGGAEPQGDDEPASGKQWSEALAEMRSLGIY